MRIPQDVSGHELATKLRAFGYEITRQVGSHIRLTTVSGGEHHITVPNHDALRIGTLSAVLAEVARHFEVTRTDVLTKLFPK